MCERDKSSFASGVFGLFLACIVEIWHLLLDKL